MNDSGFQLISRNHNDLASPLIGISNWRCVSAQRGFV
jgi:hypothetical protein